MATSVSSSVSAAFHQLLATYSPEQIVAMVAAVQPLQPLIPAQPAPVAFTSSSDDNNNNNNNNIINVKKRPGPNENRVRKRAKKAKADTMKATRPLNSWMAFRSKSRAPVHVTSLTTLGYYSPMFTSLQQKDISSILTHLWHKDPFQAKWTILAKAYSIIRDNKGKDNAPLDSFLALNAPLIGITSPAKYLEMLGWRFSVNENNETSLTHEASATDMPFDKALLTTNLSVNDVIQHCYACGYIEADGGMLIVGEGSTMTMATTAQPTEASSDQLAGPGVDAVPQESNEDASDSSSATPQNTEAGNIASAGVTAEEAAEKDFEKDLVESMLKDLDNEKEKAEVTDHAAQLGNNILGRVLLESGDEFPFNSQFDPDDSTNLHYDPFMGDPFNSFDMSAYLNEDMFSGN